MTERNTFSALIQLLRTMLIALPLAAFSLVASAQAKPRNYSSYITPFPEGGIYKVLVMGDSIGDGLYQGLRQVFAKDKTLQFASDAKYGTGFTRRVYIGRPREFAPLLQKLKPDIIVIAVGAIDASASIAGEGKNRYLFGSPPWTQTYSKRLDEFLQAAKKADVSVYWVGLPIMQDARFNENMNTLNELFREKAHFNNVKFVDTWNGFIDQYGNFSAYGPNLDGRIVRLRDKDGIRFSMDGYRKLADYVEREIRRDLLEAKSERNVPLAGAPEEQKEINRPAESGSDLAGNNPSNAGRVMRKIVSRSSTGSSGLMFGEMIASDRASGLTLLSSVTRANDPSLGGGRHNLPLNLRPYYRVLVKGEALIPKPGRADDFAYRTPQAENETTGSTQ